MKEFLLVLAGGVVVVALFVSFWLGQGSHGDVSAYVNRGYHGGSVSSAPRPGFASAGPGGSCTFNGGPFHGQQGYAWRDGRCHPTSER
jgi:hypothetical protein